ncbi:hypothetical protein P3S68_003525 [Capsicum galapagoense]
MSEPNSGHANAKWDNATHLLFLELCEKKIRKGNRPNSYLAKNEKKNMIDEFSKMTERNYTKLQMKNHWDYMKKE